MKSIFIIIFVSLVVKNYISTGCRSSDLQPLGGAHCVLDFDCGGFNAGECFNRSCLCPKHLAQSDCSYQRSSAIVAGTLNIVFAFLDIGGIGHLILKKTTTGLIQFFLILFPVIVIIDEQNVAFGTFSFVFYWIGLIWSIIDGIRMFQCGFVDNFGYCLI